MNEILVGLPGGLGLASPKPPLVLLQVATQ
jgi:hypothetical protein